MAGPIRRFTVDIGNAARLDAGAIGLTSGTQSALRIYAGLVGFIGLILLEASAPYRIDRPGHVIANLGFAVSMGPCLLMAMAFMAGTIAQIEDPQVRRRCCAGFLLAHGFIVLGVIMRAFAGIPAVAHSHLFGLQGAFPWVPLIWLPGQWFVFHGIGPDAERLLTRWFGDAPISPETRTRAYERQLRNAASQEERNRLARDLKDIAHALGIGDETVKTHVATVLGKRNVVNRAQAIVQALKRGLVSLEELE